MDYKILISGRVSELRKRVEKKRMNPMRHIFDCECIEHLLLIVFFARKLIIKQGRGDAITQQLILSAKKSGKTVII